MPQAFDECNEAGGRIRTITSGPNEGRLICCRGGNGCVLGHVRKGAGTGPAWDRGLFFCDCKVLGRVYVEKDNPDQARDAGGMFTSTGGGGNGAGNKTPVGPLDLGRVKSLQADLQQRAGGALDRGRRQDGGPMSRNQHDAAFALGYPARGASDATLAMAQRIETGSSRDAMLEAVGSQTSWHMSPFSAVEEWDAATRLGGNTDVPKGGQGLAGVKERLAGAPSSTFAHDDYKRMDEKTLTAFHERQKAHQDFFRSQHGNEVTVYRGIKGPQARKIKLAGPGDDVEVATHALSSWSTSSYDAGEFAGKSGVVLETTVKAEDIWFTSKLGARGVIRFIEDREEIVALNRSNTVKAKYVGPGHKPERRTGLI